MTLFGVFFLGFVVARKQTPESFAATAELLDVWSGLFNTVVLLSSSFCVLVALKALVDGRIVRARLFLVVTASLGVVFAIVKAREYEHLSTLGVSPTTNLFSTYYYVLTGIHLSHVIIGTILLCACAFRLRTRTGDQRFTEGAGAYWHMVDALWMVLFPLLYLVPAAGS
jgi:nitric oxide reductase NorE protein